jgi:hypothetical protein
MTPKVIAFKAALPAEPSAFKPPLRLAASSGASRSSPCPAVWRGEAKGVPAGVPLCST